MGQNVAILGASDNPERYAYKAFKLLQESGHTVYPVTPKIAAIEGVRAFSKLLEVPVPVDTLTMYVGADTSSKLKDEIVRLNPRRVIFNPGSENPGLAARLHQEGIPYEEACTLVLLRTGQF